MDERKDPVKSSAAAAHHLKDLYQTFGDWFLVMAAYDSGPLTVQRAIERTGYADYWELRRLHALPAETENYVPIFLATALIAKDPKAYGFDTPPDPPLAVDHVMSTTPTDLRLVAQLIDHPVEDLVKLNPSLQRWTTPGNDPDFMLEFARGNQGPVRADDRLHSPGQAHLVARTQSAGRRNAGRCCQAISRFARRPGASQSTHHRRFSGAGRAPGGSHGGRQ